MELVPARTHLVPIAVPCIQTPTVAAHSGAARPCRHSQSGAINNATVRREQQTRANLQTGPSADALQWTPPAPPIGPLIAPQLRAIIPSAGRASLRRTRLPCSPIAALTAPDDTGAGSTRAVAISTTVLYHYQQHNATAVATAPLHALGFAALAEQTQLAELQSSQVSGNTAPRSSLMVL